MHIGFVNVIAMKFVPCKNVWFDIKHHFNVVAYSGSF